VNGRSIDGFNILLGKPWPQPSETERTVFDPIGESLIQRGYFNLDVIGLSNVLSLRLPEVNSQLIIVSY
jgi:hypothetical protein